MRLVSGLLLCFVTLLAADPSVRPLGIGTRAYALANNFTALANDFSSMYWNPAGMAFVPVREVHCALDFNRQDMTGTLGADSEESWRQRYRISSAGLLQSLPTTRGGYAFAIGFSSPWLLDDMSNYHGADIYRAGEPDTGYDDILRAGDTLFRDRDYNLSTGQLYLWNAGMGWQIAPGLGFGISWGLLMGREERIVDVSSHTARGDFKDVTKTMERSYIGYDARIGLLYTPVKYLFFGCRLEAPRFAKVAENYKETDWLWSPGQSIMMTSYGVLKSSWSGAAGIAVQSPYATVSADATFRAPLPDAPPGTDASFWKEGAGCGIEVPLPWIASVLRGGYSFSQFDLSAMHIVWDIGGAEAEGPFSVIRGSHLVTAGYSLFLGRKFSFDIAGGYSSPEFSSGSPSWESALIERHRFLRGLASISIRY